MGQSLVRNYIHIVFSTKYREALIHPPYEEELHNYLGSICNALECPVIKVGGYTDHVHILCILSKKIALIKLQPLVSPAKATASLISVDRLAIYLWA